jgi:putative transcriptional regulator
MEKPNSVVVKMSNENVREEHAMKPSAEQRIVQGLERFADALESGEDIATRFTCRKVVLNLEPTEYTPALVKDARVKLGVSQPLFAQFLGVSAGAVQAWERGEKAPKNIACRFMDEIRRNPTYWRERFLEMAEPRSVAP